MLESVGWTTRAPMDSEVVWLHFGLQLTPPSVDFQTPPFAEPSQSLFGSLGSMPRVVTRPPMLFGPAKLHKPGASGPIPDAFAVAPAAPADSAAARRACHASSAAARARGGTGSPALILCRMNHSFGGSPRSCRPGAPCRPSAGVPSGEPRAD